MPDGEGVAEGGNAAGTLLDPIDSPSVIEASADEPPEPPGDERAAERSGLHAEFVGLFDHYLDVVYGAATEPGQQSGRWKLMRSIATEMRTRGAVEVLDCAAGGGYPLLDLVTDYPDAFQVHCTDGDRFMVQQLVARASKLEVPIEKLMPKRWPSGSKPKGLDGMIVDWMELDQLEGRYDYVLCRGNSLAYADTWAGKTKVAKDDLLKTYLDRMGKKVRPGGHLHVDAPLALGLAKRTHCVPDGRWIWEKVSVDRGRREWWLKFGAPGRATLEFKRYSSLLTIDRVSVALKELGFEETDPIELAGERASLGVIIARKP